MADVFIDNLAKQLIIDICQNPPDNDFTNFSFDQWKRLSRLLFKNIPAIFIFIGLERIFYDVENEIWTNFQVPNLEEKPRTSFTVDSGKLTISQVLSDYGVKTKGKKAVCPFHEDKDPSLSFDDQKGLWNCFGCHASGDIYVLIGMLEELKNG